MKDVFKQGQRAAIIAVTATVLFALAKAVVGLVSGSVVLMADAIHSGADSFSTFAAWIGLRIARKKPSGKFPYGFYKAENISALLISILILFAGYSIVRESFSKISMEYELSIPVIAASVAILDAIVMFIVGTYEMKVGKRINSQSLTADGKESRMHLLSSSLVLVGLVSNFLGIHYLEGIMGIFISLFIFQVGIETAKDSIFALMDVSPDKEVEKKIRNILNEVSGLRDFKNLKLRKSGPFIFGEVRAKIGKSIDIKRAHEISDDIERKIKKKVETVDSFVISFEPFEMEKQKVCIPIEGDNKLDSMISNYFGRADNFMFLKIDNKEIKDYYIKQNPYKKEKIRVGLKTSLFVTKERIDSIITREVGPISLHTLRDGIVDIYHGQKGTVRDNIEKLLSNKLSSLKKPTKEKA